MLNNIINISNFINVANYFIICPNLRHSLNSNSNGKLSISCYSHRDCVPEPAGSPDIYSLSQLNCKFMTFPF